MTTPGYAGKILRINLSTKQISSIDTSKYEAYGGGYGMGTAIFWDLCVAPGNWDLQDPFDARNIVSLMTGPLAGTGLPFAARTSVSGLSPQAWPICWFSRSNFGGSFSTMLKLAGWDGVVVEGKSDVPVFINIIDDRVTLEDAKPLWGLSTWETQDEIWRMQSAKSHLRYGAEWQKLGDRFSTLRPSIVTIGPAGENLTRIGSLIHGGGSGAGQGGFGSVFGSKKLKAIAVIGTGTIKVADAKAVRDAREWYSTTFGGRPNATGSSACVGCNRACHTRDAIVGQDSDGCMESVWYSLPSPPYKPTSRDDRMRAADIAQRYGINAFDICFGGPMAFKSPPDHPIQPAVPASTGAGWYFKQLYDRGIIGPGKEVDTAPLPMEMYDQVEFAEAYVIAICKRIGIGNLLAEGVARFAEKLGRISDMDTILRCPAWGFVDHWTMPPVEWAYGNLMDSRDINNHDMSLGRSRTLSCEDFVKVTASGALPYADDHFMFDYSWRGDQAYKTGVYSDHKAKFVAWHQHYAMFYKESVLLCDWAFSNLNNGARPDGRGATPQAEPRFLKAVTGKDFVFTDGMEIGRKIWNIKRAIFSIQGRHRDMEKFAGFMCRPGASSAALGGTLPIYDGSKWDWQNCTDLYLNEQGVEQWKTSFYEFEGWDAKSGYPKRKTLEDLGLKNVADVLEAKNRLGAV
jgi:aldehyde:ferredoxin oxidoreductase